MLRKTCNVFLFAIAVAVLFASCSRMTKTQYMSKYKDFITEVSRNYKTYSPEDWEKQDKKFTRYNNVLYKKFEKRFTDFDVLTLTKYRVQYDVYRSKDAIKGGIDDYINNGGLKEDLEFLKKQGESIGDVLNDVFN